MKISPMGVSTPTSTQLGNVTTASIAPDKIAAAKAIAAGQPRPQAMDFNDPKASLATQDVRSLKMRTQVSPDRPYETEETLTETPVNDQNAISDTVEQASNDADTRPLSPQFAALAKQRRALQIKEREIAAKEQALAAQSTTTDGTAIALERLKSDPLGVLQTAGVTYEQLTEAILNGDSANPAAQRVRELEAKLEALEKGLDTKFNERDAQAEKQVLAEMGREANKLIHENGDAYELVREQNRQQDVLDLIYRTWKQTGEVMDVSEALNEVENYLQEELLRYAKLPKIFRQLTPAEAQAQQQAQAKPQGLRTLTNRDDARPQVSRRDRALAAFHGNLKK